MVQNITDCRPAFNDHVKDPPKEASILLSICYTVLGQSTKANSILESYLEDHPNDKEASNTLRLIYEMSGKTNDDLISEYIQKTIEEPDNAGYWNKSGVLYYQQGDAENAIKYYIKAIKLDSGNATYYSNLGLSLRYLKQWKVSEKAYQKAIELDYTNDYKWNDLGNLYYDQKEYQLALSQYKKANQIYPEGPVYYYNMGLSQQNLGQTESALENFKKAIELDSANLNYYDKLGSLLFELNNYKDATGVYEDALNKFPDKSILYNDYAWDIVTYLKDQENLKKAETLALKSIEIDSLDSNERAFNWDTLAEIYLKMGKFEDAYAANKKVRELDLNGELSNKIETREEVINKKMKK